MSWSSCNIRETVDALVLWSFSTSLNLLSPMYRYMRPAKAIVLDYRCMYGFDKCYQLGLWHIYAFVNFFDHKCNIIIIIFVCIRWIFVYFWQRVVIWALSYTNKLLISLVIQKWMFCCLEFEFEVYHLLYINIEFGFSTLKLDYVANFTDFNKKLMLRYNVYQLFNLM